MMLLITWLVVILVFCVSYYLWSKIHYFSSHGVKTLPPRLLFGNLLDVTLKREFIDDFVKKGYNTFKDERYFGMYQYMVPTIIPRDLELIKNIMVRDFDSFYDRGIHIGTDADPMFGRNLIMLKGNRWRFMRSIMSPAFSAPRCRGMAPLMAESARAVSEYLRQNVADEKLMDVNSITIAYVNDVIASCAFGIKVDSLNDPENYMIQLSKKAILDDSIQTMKFFWYENMKSVVKLLNLKIIKTDHAEQFSQLFKSVLNARRINKMPPRPDLIQTLIDTAQGKVKHDNSHKVTNENNNETRKQDNDDKTCEEITDDDMVAQAVLFFSAGYDTTASLINYFIIEMAANPNVQRKLQDELDNMKEGDIYEQVQELEYLDMCVSEVLRLWPLNGVATRRTVKDYDFGPPFPGSKKRLIAPAGVHVWVPIFSIQRDEKYWPYPNKCDPERFRPENKAKIVPYTYMPFGNGPRHCIGSRFATLAAKVFLAEFFKEYSTKAPQASGRLSPSAFLLRPVEGFNVIVERRI